ncbi:hypothetical protein GCM10009530_37020 [Microbispora corallina]|uniref:Tyr recombinase domain-containing protein n=1 Tax=Microbispora corallina TaxID=83302 RepID=A0ABQ4G266_9ACTN|nr:hypothetical protein Mco01_41510 [Microbispora corallina]
MAWYGAADVRRAARAAAGRDRPPGRTPGRRAGEGPQCGGAARRRLDDYRSKTGYWIIPLLGRHRLDRLAPEHLDKALLRQAGVREARLHDARHTAGTLLVEQGVHIRVVQEILGHARVTTTERYTHIASPQVKDASERMGAAL